MVSNSYNRTRANRGTPPICHSKKIPPILLPYACMCTLTTIYSGPPPPAYTVLASINVPFLPLATLISYTVSISPSQWPPDNGTLANGDLPAGVHSLLLVPGDHSEIKITFSYGALFLCLRTAIAELP